MGGTRDVRGMEAAIRPARRLVLIVALVVLRQGFGQAQVEPPWPDTFVGRLEALALMQARSAEILSSDSATLTLETWCRLQPREREGRIAARVIRGPERPPTAEQRQRLGVGPGARVKYRFVELRCGDRVLSRAENWYLPERLGREADRLLETTDTPYGRVVQGLGPYRRTFSVKLLWRPLPEGWERGRAGDLPPETGGALAIPDTLFEHRALLYDRDHRPLAEVHEGQQSVVKLHGAARTGLARRAQGATTTATPGWVV